MRYVFFELGGFYSSFSKLLFDFLLNYYFVLFLDGTTIGLYYELCPFYWRDWRIGVSAILISPFYILEQEA